VLRGKKDEPVAAAKRNFTIKKSNDPLVEYDVEWRGCDTGGGCGESGCVIC
jgi:hypothetical protein